MCGPQGKGFGTLHNLGLRVLANALSQIIRQQKRQQQQQQQHDGTTISFLHDTIWKSIVRSLCHDIETNHSPRILQGMHYVF